MSRIATIWSLVAEAQKPSPGGANDAAAALIQRYQGAVYRYLLGALRDADAADELFQEFAVRVLQGAFRRADAQRGRFRDYLKTTLFHLVTDYQRRRQRGPKPLDTAVVQPATPESTRQSDRQFAESWCAELLARGWSALAQSERQGGQPYYSVLKFRAENPGVSSPVMAARINEQLRPARPYSQTAIRKALQRARERFAEALLDEVAHSLGDPTLDELEQELVDLDLLAYCRSALARRKQ